MSQRATGKQVRPAFPRMDQSWLLLLVLAVASIGAVSADQTSQALPELFEHLQVADDTSIAARLESRIWQEWYVAPSEDAGTLLAQLEGALRARELNTALAHADALVALEPDFAEAWNRRATVHYLLGEDDLSVADIRETLALEPRHFGAVSGLGMIFLRQGDLEAALAAFEQVLKISPQSRSARLSVEEVQRALERDI